MKNNYLRKWHLLSSIASVASGFKTLVRSAAPGIEKAGAAKIGAMAAAKATRRVK
jgi:hypothetical protein